MYSAEKLTFDIYSSKFLKLIEPKLSTNFVSRNASTNVLITEEFIRDHPGFWSTKYLLYFRKVSFETFYCLYKDLLYYLDWEENVDISCLTMEFIKEHLDQLDWDKYRVVNNLLTGCFRSEHHTVDEVISTFGPEMVNWDDLSYSRNIDINTLSKYRDKPWNWKAIAQSGHLSVTYFMDNKWLPLNKKYLHFNKCTQYEFNKYKHLQYLWVNTPENSVIPLEFILERSRTWNWDWGYFSYRNNMSIDDFLKFKHIKQINWTHVIMQFPGADQSVQSLPDVCFDFEHIFTYYKYLTLDFCKKYCLTQNTISYLCKNPNVSLEIIKYYARHLTRDNWSTVLRNNNSLTFNFIEHEFKQSYSDLWDREVVTKSNFVTIENIMATLQVYPWSLNEIKYKRNVTVKDILNFPDIDWCFDVVSSNESITLDGIIDNPQIKWSWRYVFNRNFKSEREIFVSNLKHALKCVAVFKEDLIQQVCKPNRLTMFLNKFSYNQVLEEYS